MIVRRRKTQSRIVRHRTTVIRLTQFPIHLLPPSPLSLFPYLLTLTYFSLSVPPSTRSSRCPCPSSSRDRTSSYIYSPVSPPTHLINTQSITTMYQPSFPLHNFLSSVTPLLPLFVPCVIPLSHLRSLSNVPAQTYE